MNQRNRIRYLKRTKNWEKFCFEQYINTFNTLVYTFPSYNPFLPKTVSKTNFVSNKIAQR